MSDIPNAVEWRRMQDELAAARTELEALKCELSRHFDDDEAHDTPVARDFYRYQDAGGTADWPTWWARYKGDYLA